MDRKSFLEDVMNPDKFTTFTICCSLRYVNLIDKYKAFYTTLGNLVLTPIDYKLIENSTENKEKDIINIHKIHDKKIRMSDAILVINHDLYIGDDTRREILYAHEMNKIVMYTDLPIILHGTTTAFNENLDYPIYC